MDVILDMTGGDFTPKIFACCGQTEEWYSSIPCGEEIHYRSFEIMRKAHCTDGSMLKPRDALQIGPRSGSGRFVWPLVANGSLKPIIYGHFH